MPRVRSSTTPCCLCRAAPPFDRYSKDYEKGLALYSSNVLIMEKCDNLLPDYYNFVRGVVDSGRRVAQHLAGDAAAGTCQLKAIAKRVEKKITADLEDMSDNDREAYEKFFENFGRGLKYGIYSSYGMKADELADLLLFWSAKEQKMITLAEYAKGMPEDQKAIYYAAGDSRERLAKMPVVKGVLDRGYDVLLLTQDVDEFTFQAMREYVAADMPRSTMMAPRGCREGRFRRCRVRGRGSSPGAQERRDWRS